MVRAIDVLARPIKAPRRANSYELLLHEIRWRLVRGKNAIIVVDGDTGSGKSSASLRVACDVDLFWLRDAEVAASTLTIFSAAEFTALVGFLLQGGEEWYRGRFTVFEEAGAGASSALASSASVQELGHQLDVFRQWQINVIFNMPDRQEIRSLMYRHAHFVIWAKDVDPKRRVVMARWKKRFRSERRIAFVNPYLLRRGIIDPRAPGAYVEIPWAPREIWDLYQEEKQRFFEELNRRAMKRILRLARARSDLSVSTMRDHFKDIAERIASETEDDVQEVEFDW